MPPLNGPGYAKTAGAKPGSPRKSDAHQNHNPPPHNTTPPPNPMARTKWHVCTTCPAIHQGTGQCPTCLAKTRAASDRQRRPQGNPYNSGGHRGFRAAVLARDPVCVICGLAASVVADHYPIERRDLVAAGLDPDDPERGRGLCKECHDRVTAGKFGWGTDYRR